MEKRRDQRVGPAHNNEGQQRIKETLSHNSRVSVLHYIHNSGPCRVRKRIRREKALNFRSIVCIKQWLAIIRNMVVILLLDRAVSASEVMY